MINLSSGSLNLPAPQKTGAFLIIYLGKLPPYFDFWARSCEPNQTHFHWFVYTDQAKRKTIFNKAVTLIPYSFENLHHDLMSKLNIRLPRQNTWLVCDSRILLYAIRKNEEPLDHYDFIGYSDLDVVYGKIKAFLPEHPLEYAMISAENERPCGPFTLFNRHYLLRILAHDRIKTFFEAEYQDQLNENLNSVKLISRFDPISGNTAKDNISSKLNFSHLDESRDIVRIAEKNAPVFCQADPLQPTRTRWFNHRKAIAFWEDGKLLVMDNRGHLKEGAFFHFSRLKNNNRFCKYPDIPKSDNWGIYKYGFINLNSRFARIKMMLTLFY